MELIAEGKNGQLHVDDNWVTIIRQGFGAKLMYGFTKGEKRIPIQHIVSVQYREANLLGSGYIQFTISGGNESTGGLHDAAAIDGLPPTVGVRLLVEGGRIIIRPSGTEPKLKCYVEVVSQLKDIDESRLFAHEKLSKLVSELHEIVNL